MRNKYKDKQITNNRTDCCTLNIKRRNRHKYIVKNNLYNLGLTETVSKVLLKYGVKLNKLYDLEPDAGLGNGGLGRLAACFLDALTVGGYPAMGYCIKY